MIDMAEALAAVGKALGESKGKGARPEVSISEVDGMVRVSLGYGDSHKTRVSADSDALAKILVAGRKFSHAEQTDRMAFEASGAPVKEINFQAVAPSIVFKGADCHFFYR